MHHRAENAGKITKEGRVQRQEREDEDTTEDGGQRVGRQADFHEVVRQLVILLRHRLVFAHQPGKLDTHTEDRYG